MMSQVTEVASSVGLDYRLDHTLSGNTAPAHRLLLWAQDLGKGQELLEALYAGYFTDALPIFTADDLMPFVAQVGLDTDAASSLLAADEYLDRVISDQQVAAELGATGVPFFVLDARLGISGAQPAEVFSQALAQARQARTEEG
jgi:predicted DsbA family dithiol-disulfide isomerase